VSTFCPSWRYRRAFARPPLQAQRLTLDVMPLVRMA